MNDEVVFSIFMTVSCAAVAIMVALGVLAAFMSAPVLTSVIAIAFIGVCRYLYPVILKWTKDA